MKGILDDVLSRGIVTLHSNTMNIQELRFDHLQEMYNTSLDFALYLYNYIG